MTASTLTVTEFVLARIAEDDAAAQAASVGSPSWHLGEFDETVLWWPPSSPEKIAWNRERFGDELAEKHARWNGQTIESSGPEIAPHIARHDPARVLAQCAAMRKIVERAAWVRANRTKVSHDDFCRARADLFDLAEIWSDHSDYVWDGVVHITQQAYDAGIALLEAENERP